VVTFLNDRQKRTGWLLIVVSAGYLIYFIKVRLFTAGLPIERKEWFYFVAMIATLMLGTLNVRLAALRERRKADLSPKKSA
jgi:Na+/melibiose symporter-like transporter